MPNGTESFGWSLGSDHPSPSQPENSPNLSLIETEPWTPPADAHPEISLHTFVQQAWRILEPAVPFVYSWHIGLFCEHLEAVSTGQLPEPNLLVNTPPGTSKSLIFSVLWPAWEWLWAPWTRWLTSSYDDALALRDAVKTRTLMQSEWYQRQVTESWSFTSYQNVKGYYLNNRTGWRIATSMGGGNTGWHAHRVTIDDPHNVVKAESDAERTEVLKTWREVYPSRVLPGGVRVVVGQRTHEEDLTADWLKREGQDIHHLELQMEHERPVPKGGGQHDSPNGLSVRTVPYAGGDVTSAGQCSLTGRLHDHRTQEGELLIPDRFPAAVIQRRKIELGSYAWSAQYQQRPSPRAGAIFHPAWFPDLPEGLDWSKLDQVQAWDLAFSELQSADRTAAVSLGVEQTTDPHLYAHDFFRERIDEGRLDEVMADHIMATHSRYVFVEEGIFKKAAAVRDLIRRVESLLSMRNYLCTIDTIPADADKVSRARLIEGRCKAGYIAVNRRHSTWPAMQTELTTFPKGGSDDLVDALVHAVRAAIEKLATVRAQRELLGQSSRLQYVSAQPIAKPWPASWDGLLDGAR